MNLLVFAGSNSRKSINRVLANHAAELLEESVDVEIEITSLDLNDFEMPIYSIDRESEGGIPEPAYQFFQEIGSVDGLLISFAEHNGTYTAAYKNILDWMSRIDVKLYQDKPMIALSTSPGGLGGASVMEIVKASAPIFGADLRATMSIGSFNSVFDTEKGEIVEPEIREELVGKLKMLLQN